jgi:hypothetical protein
MQELHMPHLIEFIHDWFAEVQTSPGRLRQVAFQKGMKCVAEVTPDHERASGESANLKLHDGTIAIHVPFSRFSQCALPRAA